MQQIPIYKVEKELGLSNKIRTSNSINYTSTLSVGVHDKETLIKGQTVATNFGQVDLFYLDSILTTIGWNLNDDVLDKKEVWIARSTPEDKPLNLEHNPRKVIGHIVGNYAINESGDRLSQDLSTDELPEKYHIVTSAVLYKFIKSVDEDLEKEMVEIINAIPKGEWYVSMEALFTDFDYAINNIKDNSMKVIVRDESSAFLTKYLRAYGGKGVYQNYKVGRLLRNLTFSGKGLVKNPANPESVIFNKVSAFSGTSASLGYITENKIVDENLTRIASLEASLKVSNDRNDSLQKRIDELSQNQAQARISVLETDVKNKDEKITSLSAQVDTEQKSRISAETRVKELEASLAEVNKNLDFLKLEQTKSKRVSAWVSRTGIKPEEAEVVIAKFNHLDESTFNSILELQPVKAEVQVVTPVETPPAPPPSPANVLNNVQPEPDAALVTPSSAPSNVQLTSAAMAKLLAARYLNNEE